MRTLTSGEDIVLHRRPEDISWRLAWPVPLQQLRLHARAVDPAGPWTPSPGCYHCALVNNLKMMKVSARIKYPFPFNWGNFKGEELPQVVQDIDAII